MPHFCVHSLVLYVAKLSLQGHTSIGLFQERIRPQAPVQLNE